MKYFVDLSKWEPSNQIDWPTFSKSVDMLILRVQYGSLAPDPEYANHVANAKKYNLPFMTYAFPCFVSTNDARVEARDAMSRMDKASLGIIIDIESEYDSNQNPIGITKFSNADRLEGIKAYVDELRKQGAKKVGAYIAHNVYKEWQIDTIINIFDFTWIPRYGANDGTPSLKPAFPCDLWQFTENGRLPGYNGNLDLSILNGSKTLEWFTGQSTPSTSSSGIYVPNRILKQGDSGPDVLALQKALSKVYFYPDKGAPNNGCDGIFGPKTANCVKRFQSMYCNQVDGIFGPETRAALLKLL